MKRISLCLCGKPVALHFDARGRKLDCTRVPSKDDAIRETRARITQLEKFIARILKETR